MRVTIWVTGAVYQVGCARCMTRCRLAAFGTYAKRYREVHVNQVKLVGVLLAAALLVGACGDGGSSGGSGDGPGSPGASDASGGTGGSTFNGDSATIPVIIKNWSIAIAPFDAATGKAGVMQIAGVVPPTFPNPEDTLMYRHIASSYGTEVRGEKDPQMAFVAPLGTKVLAMIDGTVCDLPVLYSDDYSVRIAPPGVPCYPAPNFGADLLFEHEHIIDPLVKVGDTVKAGQEIGSVATWMTAWTEMGFGVTEIGVFYSKGTSPMHACLANYIDPAVKDQMIAALVSIQEAWTKERKDDTLYPTEEVPGCITTEDLGG